MKLTPLDIHHKEFHHALRGYADAEVDSFLDEVADEFERLFKENIDLSEKLEAANAKVRDYQSMEVTLNNTMLAAQRSAEGIVGQAREDASTILRDAEVKAKEIIHNALTDKQRVQSDLVRIKQAEEEFRSRFRTLLEQHLRGMSEIALPADVTVLMGTTEEGVIADVDIAPAPMEAPAPADPEPLEDDAASAVADAFSEPAPVEFPGEFFDAPPATDAPEVADVPEDAEASEGASAEAFVTSVGLGEINPPDLGDDSVAFEEPSEFSVPSFDAFGEREDDVEIEEID